MTAESAAKPNRWELRACGRHGHATYRPDLPELADRLHADTPLGQAWRCLRCGNFVLGAPGANGPADEAPLVLRGKALRQATILRFLAVERLVRAVLLGVAVWAVLAFRNSQNSIQATVDRDLPVFRSVGIRVDQLAVVGDLQKALDQTPGRLALIAALLAGYAALEVVEGIGLWLLKRWGEYFAVIATAIFLPLEVRELLRGITFTRGAAFVINLAAVVYLLLSKRLFGLRGGRTAYDAERRGEQLLEVEQSALQSPGSGDGPAISEVGGRPPAVARPDSSV
ncbi:MAG: DUF2127 domain-containing protein [Actinomycetota bacterium]|nr:DUF2127 domain-containing protein [Actinomycetota bacterium]